ncbi:hypothetical protein J4421_05940 [Candidatus Woesearchaeota archaeon]|nr:hypothetical protein [Candidatus Woesearchaeota archaeon]
MWNNCFLVDKFDPSGADLLKNECIKANLNQEEIDILVRPQKINFIEQSNVELHSLALQLQKKNKPDPLVLLKPFTEKWFFIQNSWGNVIFLEAKDFLQSIQDLMKESSERLQNVIKQYEDLSSITKKKVDNLYLTHTISPELKNIFHLFRTLGVIRDERKEIVLHINHFNERVARHLGKEFKIGVSLLRRALPSELALLTSKGELKKLLPLLQQREDAVYLHGVSVQTMFIGGKEAKVIIEMLHEKLLQHGEELKGIIACKGKMTKIRGRVKIILGETHFSKFEDGDILVAPMTRPEYVPLMKRAKAVITDEGGITCHAAIISRELNIPCIIGTSVATKKLFDNREIEVDTEKGKITLI